MRIKLCGLSRREDILAVNEALPDYVGFVFAESRRRVSKAQAAEMKRALDARIAAVGVFVNAPVKEILGLCEAGVIDLVQLHGDEDAGYIEALRRQTACPIIRAVRVETTQTALDAQALPCDYLLLDSYQSGSRGGTGIRFDWSAIPALQKPFFLAGGIDATNLEAAARLPAFCLDISSGAETDGRKDLEKITALIQTVRRQRP